MLQAHQSDCPTCGKALKVRPEQVGRMVRCPACQQPFELQLIRTSAATSLAGMTVEQLPPGSGGTPRSLLGSLEKLGRYEIRSVLGEGGFGRVYRAYDPQLDREVALKVPLFGNQDKVRTHRFLTEAKSAGKLQHPCIVPTFDSGQVDGRYYIATAFIEGQPLSEQIRRGKIGLRQAAEWVRDLAEALAYAHQRDIVHRDIKPHNVMIDAQHRPHLMDFGLAKRTNDESSVTTDGSLLGTPAYMSPEQARGEHTTVGAASDQYSLGVVLYELLTGKRPFDGAPHVVIGLVAGQSPPSPRSIRRQIPADIEAICQKAMHRDPAQRYSDCAAFAKDLTRWLDGRSTLARPLSLTEQATRWVRRHAVVSGLTAAVVVLLTAFAVTNIFRGSNPTQVPLDVTQRPPTTPDDSSTQQTKESKPNPSRGEQSSVSETTDPTKGWHGWPADSPKPAIAPFDAAEAKEYQERWAAYLKVPVEYENSLGMKFRLIPPGEYQRGSPPQEIEVALATRKDAGWVEVVRGEGPLHGVVLTRPVYVAVHETTQENYESIMMVNPAHFSAGGGGKQAVAGIDTRRFPVETLSQVDAAEFCTKLSTREKFAPRYRMDETGIASLLNGTGYRLLTEAEWEFACRAGTTTPHHSGNASTQLAAAGWYSGNSGGRPHPVGELMANAWGLFDLHGNVLEWCEDGMNSSAYQEYQLQPAVDPRHPRHNDQTCVFRGGCFANSAMECRSAARNNNFAKARHSFQGFRVALSVDAVKQALKPKTDTPWHGWPADAPKPAIAPFNAQDAKAYQETWAAYLKVPVEYENSIGIKLRLIPPGEFLMGSTPAEIEETLKLAGENKELQDCIKSDSPQQRVVLTQPFYLGVYETTQNEFETILGANPSGFSVQGEHWEVIKETDTSRYPVERVSWYDAVEFCMKLGQEEACTPCYVRDGEAVTCVKGNGYRLPTEAEWEFACRAGTKTRYWIGDNDRELLKVAWILENSGNRTHAVGELKANPFGLFDVHGNAYEWCQDWYHANGYLRYSDGIAIDPQGRESGGIRVISGGSIGPSLFSRTTFRTASNPYARYSTNGFRVAFSVDAVRAALTSRSQTPLANLQSARRLKSAPTKTEVAQRWRKKRQYEQRLQSPILQGAMSAYRDKNAAQLTQLVAQARKQKPPDKDLVRMVEHLQRLLAPPPLISLQTLLGTQKTVKVADLVFDSATVGWGEPLRNQVPPLEYQLIFLRVGQEFFESGIWAHSPSRHVLKVNSSWSTFRSKYGINDGNPGSVIFVVLGDGKELFRSKVIRDHIVRDVTVSMANVKSLELIVEAANDGISSDCAVWLDPELQR